MTSSGHPFRFQEMVPRSLGRERSGRDFADFVCCSVTELLLMVAQRGRLRPGLVGRFWHLLSCRVLVVAGAAVGQGSASSTSGFSHE